MIRRAVAIAALSLAAASATAQVANDETTQRAILDALPEGLGAETASADEIARAAIAVAYSRDGKLEDNLTQVTVSLGELTQAGTFRAAPKGEGNPVERLYKGMVNMASSFKRGMTPQDIMRVSNAVIAGMNYLNRPQGSQADTADMKARVSPSSAELSPGGK